MAYSMRIYLPSDTVISFSDFRFMSISKRCTRTTQLSQQPRVCHDATQIETILIFFLHPRAYLFQKELRHDQDCLARRPNNRTRERKSKQPAVHAPEQRRFGGNLARAVSGIPRRLAELRAPKELLLALILAIAR